MSSLKLEAKMYPNIYREKKKISILEIEQNNTHT